MINDQDKRAIETMARCGCEFDSLCSMFPKVPKEDIIAIWNYVVDAGRRMEDPALFFHRMGPKQKLYLKF